MDTLAHALWTGAAAKTAKDYTQKIKRIWLAVLFGVVPDFFSFGAFIVTSLALDGFDSLVFKPGPPPEELVPASAKLLYRFSHSLVIFAAVFFLLWLIRKKPFWELGGWGLHILIDIPTHTRMFFPTPFLWPFSLYTVNGVSWAEPWFLALNYALIILTYIGLFWRRQRRVSDGSTAPS